MRRSVHRELFRHLTKKNQTNDWKFLWTCTSLSKGFGVDADVLHGLSLSPRVWKRRLTSVQVAICWHKGTANEVGHSRGNVQSWDQMFRNMASERPWTCKYGRRIMGVEMLKRKMSSKVSLQIPSHDWCPRAYTSGFTTWTYHNTPNLDLWETLNPSREVIHWVRGPAFVS